MAGALVLTGSSNTLTLPAASSTIFAPGMSLAVANNGAANWTLANNTGLTLTGVSSPLVPGAQGTFVANADGVHLDFFGTNSAGASGANPTATIGWTAVPGSSSNFTRSDGAPALPTQLAAPSGTVGAPTYSFSTDATTGIFLPASGEIEVAVGGADKLDYNKTQSNSWYFTPTVNFGGNASVGGNLSISSGTKGLSIATSNNSMAIQIGGTGTYYMGIGATGNSTSALGYNTSGGAGSASFTPVLTWNISSNLVTLAGSLVATLAADTGQSDATVCDVTSTGQFYYGTGTGGICLTTSSMHFKRGIADVSAGLSEVMAIPAKNFRYDSEHGDRGEREQFGFLAEDVAKVSALGSLVRDDTAGNPVRLDYMGLVPVLWHAVQQQQVEIEELKARVH
jgi:hypothetical protein